MDWEEENDKKAKTNEQAESIATALIAGMLYAIFFSFLFLVAVLLYKGITWAIGL